MQLALDNRRVGHVHDQGGAERLLERRGERLDELRAAIEARFLATLLPMELLLPYGEGGTLSELHELAGELERKDTAEGVRVRARVPAGAAQRFERFSVNGAFSDGADE